MNVFIHAYDKKSFFLLLLLEPEIVIITEVVDRECGKGYEGRGDFMD
jgi:hypothetical protein